MDRQMVTVLYMIVLFAALYFLMIRPQQQRQKKLQQLIADLKVNDLITTAGGIYGTIVKVKEDTFIIRVADNVRFEILKSSVMQKRTQGEEEEVE
ncbi:MAG TPA: preprotein translocase subunit YajC [Desulfotomaculum sp.]|nr:MAG: Preprotein translocase, YajC subunit [Desulfotomaculum sp. 46_80]KUK85184.1 MAG: Preprotein translocase, YajC subunit [Desulfofundulus kuznetsovii]HAG12203.1 preprotein translocase subunit YajC [Desulfotomaculum sp.]HBY04407.1 preprotein translocase subunit YajC [Desulfotomaculum sp.]